jgi:hypothetical protein
MNFSDVSQIASMVIISLTFLIMLYAVHLMNRKIRLIESELSSIKKDTALISDELETIAPKLKSAQKS